MKKIKAENIYMFKMSSGEELIAELIENEQNEGYIVINNPLVFETSAEEISAKPWCTWSRSRQFALTAVNIIIADVAMEHLAEMYIAEMTEADTNAQESKIFVPEEKSIIIDFKK